MSNELVDNFLAEHDAASETPMIAPADTQKKKMKKRKNGPVSDVQEEVSINDDFTATVVTDIMQLTKKPKVQENRAIYVTNLPPDTTMKEIEDTFKRFGIIDKGTDGKPRIKMYTDDEGKFNGEALIVYFRKESIRNAITVSDDYPFRMGDDSHGVIHVKEADLSYKRNKDGDQIASKLTRKDKKASELHRAELNRMLAGWSDNEEQVAEAFAPKKNKWAKFVVIKHAFTLKELDEDAGAYLEIKEDMRTEAEKHGDVTNVTLFDKEEDGIVTVRFREFESAEAFRDAVDGRDYARRKLEATIGETKPRFKKSARGEEPDSEEEERLEKIAKE
ncbi:Nn.00g017390.m01.CDS01 [Neocucurbitaria sp. VM-36]